MVEPAAGVDRAMLAFIVDAYETEEVEGRERTVLRLHPRLAPVKVAVLPLVSKEGMPERAREVFDSLRRRMPAEYDEGGSIGKRYRRQDEIGTPWGVTVDGQTMEDGTVTLRDRDSLEQTRVPPRGSARRSPPGSRSHGRARSWVDGHGANDGHGHGRGEGVGQRRRTARRAGGGRARGRRLRPAARRAGPRRPLGAPPLALLARRGRGGDHRHPRVHNRRGRRPPRRHAPVLGLQLLPRGRRLSRPARPGNPGGAARQPEPGLPDRDPGGARGRLGVRRDLRAAGRDARQRPRTAQGQGGADRADGRLGRWSASPGWRRSTG